MKREIFWEAHLDSTSFPSGGRKIYHERSAIGDMLSAIQNIVMRGLGSKESSLYSCMGGKMLSVSDLIDINYIPSESDISLELLVDFYEDYLCKRIFIFTLRDGQVVKLFFRDALLLEGIKLWRVEKTKIYEHLEKLREYNAERVPIVIMPIYGHMPKEKQFWEKYVKLLREYQNKKLFDITGVEVVDELLKTEFSAGLQYIVRTRHNYKEFEVVVYHIMINIKRK